MFFPNLYRLIPEAQSHPGNLHGLIRKNFPRILSETTLYSESEKKYARHLMRFSWMSQYGALKESRPPAAFKETVFPIDPEPAIAEMEYLLRKINPREEGISKYERELRWKTLKAEMVAWLHRDAPYTADEIEVVEEKLYLLYRGKYDEFRAAMKGPPGPEPAPFIELEPEKHYKYDLSMQYAFRGPFLPKFVPPLELEDGLIWFAQRKAETPYRAYYMSTSSPAMIGVDHEDLGIEQIVFYSPEALKKEIKERIEQAKEEARLEEEAKRYLEWVHEEELRQKRREIEYEHEIEAVGKELADEYEDLKQQWALAKESNDLVKMAKLRPRLEELEEQIHRHDLEVYIPGWKDIIHLKPRYQFTKRELEELKKPSRKRDWSVFSKAALREIYRRRAVAARFRKSPTPQWARKIQSVVKFIDDIEDMISTAIMIGTVGVLISGTLPEVVAAALAVGATGSEIANITNAVLCLPLGPMGAKRAIGYLADAATLSLATNFRAGKQVSKLALAVQEAEELPMWQRALKLIKGWPRQVIVKAGETTTHSLEIVEGTIRWVEKTRPALEVATEKLLPFRYWLASAIEAGQVSDQLFGVGLCIGPAMGAITDLMYGIPRTMEGKTVKIVFPKQISDDKLFSMLVPAKHKPFYKKTKFGYVPDSALLALHAASVLLAGADSLTGEELLRTAVGTNLALQIASEYMRWSGWAEKLPEIYELDAVPIRVADPATRAALELEGLDPEEGHTTPSAWDVEPRKVIDEVMANMMRIPQAMEVRIKEYGFWPESLLIQEIASRSYNFIPGLFGQTPEDVKVTLRPERQIAELMAAERIMPPYGATEAETRQFIVTAANIIRNEQRTPTRDELKSIAKQVWGDHREEPPKHAVRSGKDLGRVVISPIVARKRTIYPALTPEDFGVMQQKSEKPWTPAF